MENLSFSIGLKNRTDDTKDFQTVTFSKTQNLIEATETNGALSFAIEIDKSGAIVEIKDEQNKLEFLEKNQEYKAQALYVKNIEIDGESNIKISFESDNNNQSFKTMKIYPNEIVATTMDGKEVKIPTSTMNIQLPENIFTIIANKQVSARKLPTQMFEAAKHLNDAESKSFVVGNSALQIVKTKTTPAVLYLANGDELVQFSINDAHIHFPNNETDKKGTFCIIKNKARTNALAISHVSKETLDEIIAFVEENQEEKIHQISDEQFKAQILRPAKLKPLKATEKFITSFTRGTQKTEDKKEETIKVVEVEDDEEEELNIAKNIKKAREGNADDSPAANEAKETENKDDSKAELAPEETNDGNATEGVVDVAPGAAPQTNPADEKKKDEKKPAASAEAPKKEEVKTVDLSNLTAAFGAAIFVLGLFAGFTGILLSIIAIGIGSGSYASASKLKKVKLFPLGKDTAVKEAAKLPKPELTKPSTPEKEKEAVAQLEDKGVIGKELADKMREQIETFAKQATLLGKYEALIKDLIEEKKLILTDLKNEHEPFKYGAQMQALSKEIAQLEENHESLIKSLKPSADLITDAFKQLPEYNKALKEIENLEGMDIENQMKTIKTKIDSQVERQKELQKEVDALKASGKTTPELEKKTKELNDLTIEIKSLGRIFTKYVYYETDYVNAKKKKEQIETNYFNIDLLKAASTELGLSIKQEFEQVQAMFEEHSQKYPKTKTAKDFAATARSFKSETDQGFTY
ncbi:MAG: hypothetical protein ACOX6H_03425 [Christensenellales bacterium]|jgi:hypothetical protein